MRNAVTFAGPAGTFTSRNSPAESVNVSREVPSTVRRTNSKYSPVPGLNTRPSMVPVAWVAAGVWAGTAVAAPSASQPAIAASVDLVFMGLGEECALAAGVGADGAREMTKPPVSVASSAR